MRHHSFRTAIFYGGLGPRHYLRARSLSSALFSSMPSVTHSRLLAIGHPTRCHPPQSLTLYSVTVGSKKKKKTALLFQVRHSAVPLCVGQSFLRRPPHLLCTATVVTVTVTRLTSHVTTLVCVTCVAHTSVLCRRGSYAVSTIVMYVVLILSHHNRFGLLLTATWPSCETRVTPGAPRRL
jgi:hypothetical protein